jgi:hypothetical protein
MDDDDLQLDLGFGALSSTLAAMHQKLARVPALREASQSHNGKVGNLKLQIVSAYADDDEVAIESAPADERPIKIESDEQPASRQDSGTEALVKEEKEESKAYIYGDSRSRKEHTGTVVHILELSWFTTDIEVEAACGAFGKVLNVKFFEDRSNGKSVGSCAVEFTSHDEAKACLNGLNGQKVGQDDAHVTWPGKRPPYKSRYVYCACRKPCATTRGNREWFGLNANCVERGPCFSSCVILRHVSLFRRVEAYSM